MSLWKYQVVILYDSFADAKAIEDTLNSLGKDGWELISIYSGMHGYPTGIFKKPCNVWELEE
jgi:hypothetical protein